MAAFSSRRKPVAIPNLRGLAVNRLETVEAVEQLVVYPWTQVELRCGPPRAVLYNLDGSRVEPDGEAVIQDAATLRLAERAQERAFRKAWRLGNFFMVESYRVSRAETLGTTLFLLTCGASCASVLLDVLSSLPRNSPLLWPALGFAAYLVLFTLGAWWLGFIFLGMSRGVVRLASYDACGIHAELSNGGSFWAPWAEFEGSRTFASSLLFQGGRRLQFMKYTPRLRLALRVISEELHPERLSRRKHDWHLAAIRCTIYWLAFCLVISLLSLPVPARVGATLIAGLLLTLPPYIKWREVNPPRRKRRATAALTDA